MTLCHQIKIFWLCIGF